MKYFHLNYFTTFIHSLSIKNYRINATLDSEKKEKRIHTARSNREKRLLSLETNKDKPSKRGKKAKGQHSPIPSENMNQLKEVRLPHLNFGHYLNDK